MKKYLILLVVAVLLLAGCTYESYDNNYYGSDDSGSHDEYDYYQEWYYWSYVINGASADKQIVFILIPAADAKRGAANGGLNGGSDVQIPGEIAGGTHVYMISASELQKIVEQGGEVFIVPMSGGTSAEPSVNEIGYR